MYTKFPELFPRYCFLIFIAWSFHEIFIWSKSTTSYFSNNVFWAINFFFFFSSQLNFFLIMRHWDVMNFARYFLVNYWGASSAASHYFICSSVCYNRWKEIDVCPSAVTKFAKVINVSDIKLVRSSTTIWGYNDRRVA